MAMIHVNANIVNRKYSCVLSIQFEWFILVSILEMLQVVLLYIHGAIL